MVTRRRCRVAGRRYSCEFKERAVSLCLNRIAADCKLFFCFCDFNWIMMMKRSLVFVASLMMLSVALQAQDKVVKSVLEMGKADNRTMEHADYLANVIGGRPVGSHNLQDAEAWVAEQFKSWGLEVMVQEVGEVEVGFSRGPWFGHLIGGGLTSAIPNDGNLHFVTPSYTAGTRGPQRGHVLVEPKTRGEFDRIKGALKGSWLLVDGPARGFPVSWSVDSLHVVKRDEYEAAGVLGFIQAADLPMQAHYDNRNWNKMTMETLPRVCEIMLERAQYDEIRRMVAEHRDFQLEFDIRNHFFRGPVKYHNVIGIMKGTRYPSEYVLLGGHLDAYDVASGAVDDGNGVSVTMEAARMLAMSGAKPKRTIMFCIWTGEEYGLLGSKYFVENKTVPLDKISNYFNRDGGPLAAAGITVPEAMFADFEKICEPVLNYTEDIPFKVEKREGEPRPRPTQAGGSDHAHFAMEGVPTISFNERDVKGYNFNYRVIWHTEADNYDKLYPDYMEHSSVVTAVTVYGLANLDHLLSREGLYKE